MKKLENQEKIWDKIAPEWYEFKNRPTEAVLEFLKNKTGKVLDLGSGSGRHLVRLKEGRIYLVDFSQEMLDFAKKKAGTQRIPAEYFKSELSKLPFKNNYFDSAIAVSSIHCIKTPEERKKTIEELYRVLKPETEAYIGVWNKDSKRFKNSEKNKLVKWRDKGTRYYYLFEEKEIQDLFKLVGFKIIKSLNSEMMINFIVKKISNNSV